VKTLRTAKDVIDPDNQAAAIEKIQTENALLHPAAVDESIPTRRQHPGHVAEVGPNRFVKLGSMPQSTYKIFPSSRRGNFA
jgi:hypothetical protein